MGCHSSRPTDTRRVSPTTQRKVSAADPKSERYASQDSLVKSSINGTAVSQPGPLSPTAAVFCSPPFAMPRKLTGSGSDQMFSPYGGPSAVLSPNSQETQKTTKSNERVDSHQGQNQYHSLESHDDHEDPNHTKSALFETAEILSLEGQFARNWEKKRANATEYWSNEVGLDSHSAKRQGKLRIFKMSQKITKKIKGFRRRSQTEPKILIAGTNDQDSGMNSIKGGGRSSGLSSISNKKNGAILRSAKSEGKLQFYGHGSATVGVTGSSRFSSMLSSQSQSKSKPESSHTALNHGSNHSTPIKNTRLGAWQSDFKALQQPVNLHTPSQSRLSHNRHLSAPMLPATHLPAPQRPAATTPSQSSKGGGKFRLELSQSMQRSAEEMKHQFECLQRSKTLRTTLNIPEAGSFGVPAPISVSASSHHPFGIDNDAQIPQYRFQHDDYVDGEEED